MGTYNIDEIIEIVEREGFAWAVAYGILPKEIEDKNLAALWEKARYPLSQVDDALGGMC